MTNSNLRACIIFILALPAIAGLAQKKSDFSLAVQSGHTGQIQQIALRNKLMVTQNKASDIKLWDVQSGLELGKLPINDYSYNACVALNPTATEIAVAGHKIVIYDLIARKLKRDLTVSKTRLQQSAVAYSKTNATLVTAEIIAGSGTQLYVYTADGTTPIQTLEGPKGVFKKMAISNDGKTLAVSTDDDITVMSLPTGKILMQLGFDGSGGMVFSNDGLTLYVASIFGTRENVRDKYYQLDGLYVLNLKKKEVARAIKLNSPRAIALSGDEKLLALATNHGAMASRGSDDVTILTLPEFKTVLVTKVEDDNHDYANSTFSLAFDEQSKVLITGNLRGNVKFFSTANWAKLRESNALKVENPYRVKFVDKGTKMMVEYEYYALVWDLQTLRPAYTISHNPRLEKEELIMFEYATNADGSLILSGSSDQHINVWDASNGKLVKSIKIDYPFKFKYALPKNFISNDIFRLEVSEEDGSGQTLCTYNLSTGQLLPTRNDGIALSSDMNYGAKQGYKANAKDPYEYGTDFVQVRAKGGADVATFDHGKKPRFAPKGPFLLVEYNPITLRRDNPDANYDIELYDVANNKSLMKIAGAIDFSPSGKYAYAFEFNSTRSKIYQMPEWKELVTLEHDDDNGEHIFTPDEKYVAVVTDGPILLYEVATGKRIATMVTIGKEIYAVVNGDGYYKAHPKAYGAIAFKQGFRAYPFEQFDLRFNRPHVVMQSFPYADQGLVKIYNEAFNKRVKRMGFTPEDLEGELQMPEVSISSAIPVTTTTDQLTLTVNAKDNLYNLKSLNVIVNGVPVFGRDGQSITGKETQREVTVTLAPGSNKLQVSVMNSKGVESLLQRFDINYNADRPKGQVYVLGIGVSEFKDSNYNLTYAAKDATDLTSLYQGNSHFSKVNVLNLNNGDFSKENLLQAKLFLSKSNVDDLVIVHVATHGLLDSDLNYYLATADVNFENPSIGGLAYEDFEDLFDKVKSRQKLVLIDACHSGEIDKDENTLSSSADPVKNGVSARGFKSVKSKSGLTNSYEIMQELFADIKRGTGAVVISSASGKEYAFESEAWKNGVFTYAVLNGIKSRDADLNRDGKIVASELREFVTKQVIELTGGKQHPTSRNENLESDFEVW